MATDNPTNSDPSQQSAPAAPAPQAPSDPAGDYDFQSAFSGDFLGQSPDNQPAPGEPSGPQGGADPGQEPQANPFVEQARSLGLNVRDDASQEEVFQAITDQYQQLQPYAQYGQSLMPHAQQISNLLAQQQRAQQQRAQQQPEEDEWSPEQYFKQKWKAPEWDDQYTMAIQNGMVERDAQTGLYKAVPGYEMMVSGILPGLNEAHQHQAQQWQALMRGNPYENFYNALREPLQRSWKEDISSEIHRQLGRHERLNAVQQFEAENADWMYQQDARGQYVPTEIGGQFLQNVKMLRDSGMNDPGQIIQVAQAMLGQPPQQPAGDAPEGDQHPTIPFPQQQQRPAPQQQSPQRTFMQNALDKAGHRPSSGASAADSPDAPATVSQGDLDNMFTNAQRAKAARTG